MNESHLQPFGFQGKVSRRHAIKTFTAVAAGAVFADPLSKLYGETIQADEHGALLLTPDSSPHALGEVPKYDSSPRQSAPTLIWDEQNKKVWTTWTRLSGGKESVFLRSFTPETQTWSERIRISGKTAPSLHQAGESAVALVNGRLLVVWPEFDGQCWTLFGRSFDPSTGSVGKINTLASANDGYGLCSLPSLCSGRRQTLLTWQAKDERTGPFKIQACMINADGSPVGKTITIAGESDHDCCRPATAYLPDNGKFAIAYDRQDRPGTQNVCVSMFDPSSGLADKPIPVSNHPATDIAPSLACSPDGKLLWVAWHSNRKGADGWDIVRWYRIRTLRLSDNTWHKPEGCDKTGDLKAKGENQGFEFTRLAISPAGTVCVTGRPSHNFCLQYYGQNGQSPLYRVPKDGWGGRGKHLQCAFDDQNNLWVTRRDLGYNVLHRVSGFDESLGKPKLVPVKNPAKDPTKKLTGVTPRIEWPPPALKKPGTDEFSVYFGDIHGHSWQSDGMGDPNEAYLRARDVFHDDFHVLSDHDNFVGKRLMDGEWQQQKDLADHYNQPGKFSTLYGQEWTSPRTTAKHGWGHFIVYSADPKTPLFDHKSNEYRDLPQLLEGIKPYNAITIPHHIGWTGVRWEAWDENIIPVAEICSVHGAYEFEGNTPIAHRGGIKGCFHRDGLARGLKIGVAGGADQHGLIYHHGICWKRNVYRSGITGVWAKELTREAIIEAFRKRRTFATSGVKILPRLTVNGRIPGSEIKADTTPEINVDVTVPSDEGKLARIELIRNGETINTSTEKKQRSFYTFKDEKCPKGANHYYLRILLTDNNMAWTSPVWVKLV